MWRFYWKFIPNSKICGAFLLFVISILFFSPSLHTQFCGLCLVFFPEVISQGYFPGIIDWFGGIGGLIEFQASLLASHSLGAMALAYYNYEDLTFRVEK